MLAKTNYTVSKELLQEAKNHLPSIDFRTTINQPTGDFFYDPWEIKPEFKNTVWARLINAINEPVGEARIIVLNPQMTYHIHSDIDDRFHLNIENEASYLIDCDAEQMHKLESDGIWYEMNAGKLHTASNFGRIDRVQLVVRKNLIRGKISSPVKVKILSNIPTLDDSRFIFDNTVSPWLNNANKKQIIDNFNYSSTHVSFDLEESFIDDLKSVLSDNFRIE